MQYKDSFVPLSGNLLLREAKRADAKSLAGLIK